MKQRKREMSTELLLCIRDPPGGLFQHHSQAHSKEQSQTGSRGREVVFAKHFTSARYLQVGLLILMALWMKNLRLRRVSNLPKITQLGCHRSTPVSQVCVALRTAYLDHGPHDFPGFLVKSLSIPPGIEALELCGQPVVLSNKEGVHGGELRHFTRAGVPLGRQKPLSFQRPSPQKRFAPLKLPVSYSPSSPPISSHGARFILLYGSSPDTLVHHNSFFCLGTLLARDAYLVRPQIQHMTTLLVAETGSSSKTGPKACTSLHLILLPLTPGV